MNRTLLTVLFTVASVLCSAQNADAQIKITGTTQVPANKLVRLKAEGLPPLAGITWDVFPFDAQADIATTTEEILEFVAPPGTYIVQANTFTGGGEEKIVAKKTRITVTIGGVLPVPPGPTPIPVPPGPTPVPPGPTPITKAWLVIVEETEDASNNRGALMTDKDLVSYLQTKKWKVRITDKDVVDANGKVPTDLAPYITRAKSKGLPYHCVVDQDGKIRSEGTVPDSADDFLAILKKVGG